MATWQEIEQEAPEFAAAVRRLFEAGKHMTMATLRRDGSPRISGTEVTFAGPDLTFGSMAGSMKLRDLRRDPRTAVHSPTPEPPPDHPEQWSGDAKIAGRAVEIPAPEGSEEGEAGHFRVDIHEVVLTRVGTPADHLVIESWHPGLGYRRRTRA